MVGTGSVEKEAALVRPLPPPEPVLPPTELMEALSLGDPQTDPSTQLFNRIIATVLERQAGGLHFDLLTRDEHYLFLHPSTLWV